MGLQAWTPPPGMVGREGVGGDSVLFILLNHVGVYLLKTHKTQGEQEKDAFLLNPL